MCRSYKMQKSPQPWQQDKQVFKRKPPRCGIMVLLRRSIAASGGLHLPMQAAIFMSEPEDTAGAAGERISPRMPLSCQRNQERGSLLIDDSIISRFLRSSSSSA